MMTEEVEKSSLNNMLFLKKSNVKEEFDDSYIDDYETSVNVKDTELNDYLWDDKIKEYKVARPMDDIKMEVSSFEACDIVINDNVKIENEITTGDIKNEFGSKLLFCDHCNEYYEDYCTKCEMLAHILNGIAQNNAPMKEIPNDILEIRESSGRVGVFALKVIPQNVKIGPFNGLSTSECPLRLKGGKFLVSKGKVKLLNWMQHVNPAMNIFHQNLIPFSCEDKLYYKCNRVILAGEELLVYFGAEYEDSLHKNIEMDFVPPIDDVGDVFACTFCCLGFSAREHLVNHKTTCSKETNADFSIDEIKRCPFCKTYFYEKEFLVYHKAYCYDRYARCIPLTSNNQAVAEANILKTQRHQMYECRQCEYQTDRKSNLESHTRSNHLKEFNYKCEMCSYETHWKSHLRMHVKTKHLKEFKYKCDTCEFNTNVKSNFERHTKSKHLMEFNYKCETCHFRTNSKSNLQIHVKTKHLREFNYECETCTFRTNKKCDLDKHTKSKHLKAFDYCCEMCEYKTNYPAYLGTHLRTKHLNEFQYECEICGYKTNKKANVERHVKTKHLKEFSHACETCDYKTNTKCDMEMHTKSKHLKEFKYKCETCEYKTNLSADLGLHVKSKHLKEYRYECDICKYKTNYKDCLKIHVKTKHLKEFDYECEMCEYKTNYKSHLKAHIKGKHQAH